MLFKDIIVILTMTTSNNMDNNVLCAFDDYQQRFVWQGVVNMKIVLEIMVDKYVYCILFKYVLDLPHVGSYT